MASAGEAKRMEKKAHQAGHKNERRNRQEGKAKSNFMPSADWRCDRRVHTVL
jgi:hypothetical protein